MLQRPEVFHGVRKNRKLLGNRMATIWFNIVVEKNFSGISYKQCLGLFFFSTDFFKSVH